MTEDARAERFLSFLAKLYGGARATASFGLIGVIAYCVWKGDWLPAILAFLIRKELVRWLGEGSVALRADAAKIEEKEAIRLGLRGAR